ncbi:phospholipase [Actinoplanes solisilvae]|uniref:phospholipase n=1 Tax=Actinoplanes solisilvae TaxID=2486853 RepID=UPI001F0BFC8A|nr:phospholipase [Actinoplanes solisilvae]
MKKPPPSWHSMTPSGQGTVMLNIGAGIGALIINTPGRMHGREIEVSPVDDAATRTQAAVRARYVRGGVCFSVVLDSLPEGRYTVWDNPITPLGEIDVPGGGVAQFTWPMASAAA